jgi:voltage-gated potassium channel Kch
MFIAHMISCFIYYISKDNHSETTWISKLNYHNWYEYYITGLYFAIITMITIGYGDVVPVSLTEKIFVMSMTFISCGVFAYSLNTISRIISEVSQRRSKLRKKMIQLNIHIESKGLSKGIAVKVRKYLEYFYQENEQD